MTNALTTNPFGGAVALNNAQAMASALSGSASNGTLGGAPEGSQYLNFSGKRGVYEFGAQKESVDASEIWLVNIAAFEDGFVCWKGGQPVATRLSNIYNGQPIPTPEADELGPFDNDKGEGWFVAKSMIVKSVDEDDRQGYFKINSRSGVSSIADLQSEIAARFNAGRPAWPLIQLGSETFTAKGHKNSKPKFGIYGWLSDEAVQRMAEEPDADVDDLIELSNGVADEDDEPAPTKRKRRSAL